MRIAFYAPMKPPTHPTPSGDRRMARLLMAALREAGHEVVLASAFRAFEPEGVPERQAEIREKANAIAARLIAEARAAPDTRPDLWFTYHVYYKAPDWLGPRVSSALGIPYAMAEASFAPKRAGGPWQIGHRATEQAIATAGAVFCMTRRDMACVAPVTAPGRLHHLPPFLDAVPAAPARETARQALAERHPLRPETRWLLAVAMMRPGDKLDSYRQLGAALARLDGDDWQLIVVGDGAARSDVTAALAPLGPRTVWLGALTPEDLTAVYAAADIFVWPAVSEGYGMAVLEAQAAGVPAIAGDDGGIRDVVEDGETGLLVPRNDPAAFADAVARLLDDTALRARLGQAARARGAAERTLPAAARQLDAVLAGLVA